MSRWWAVPFGENRCSRNSDFTVGGPDVLFPVLFSATYPELLELHKRICEKEGEDPTHHRKPAGFWIISEENLNIANIAYEVDVETQQEENICNEIALRTCERLAKRTVEREIQSTSS